MKKMRKISFALPVLAGLIAIVLSAFTIAPKHATTVTSYFANESQATGSLVVGTSTVPAGYTDVTTAVNAVGETSYITTHCPTSSLICYVQGQSTNGGAFIVEEIVDGAWRLHP